MQYEVVHLFRILKFWAHYLRVAVRAQDTAACDHLLDISMSSQTGSILAYRLVLKSLAATKWYPLSVTCYQTQALDRPVTIQTTAQTHSLHAVIEMSEPDTCHQVSCGTLKSRASFNESQVFVPPVAEQVLHPAIAKFSSY